ncbi:MAG: DNA polymerase Y family protein [Pseudorhodoplanes sp.]
MSAFSFQGSSPNPASRRILSLWLRRLPTDRLSRLSPELADRPFAVTANVKSARRICGLNDEAAKLGLRAGMALADARAMYPDLAAIDADHASDARLLEAIADWCDRYTPLVGLDPPDGLLLDITGCAHLFGGESALCRDLMRRLAGQGFHTHVAVADNAGCAHAVARYGARGIVPSGGMRDALQMLPLVALRIEPGIAAPLAQAGLKTIGQIIELPRAPLAARFGEGFVRRIDQALGIEDEPITPRLPVPSFLVEQRFAEPIGREEDVLGTVLHLARELSRAMERHGKGARRLQTALFRTDGKVARIEIGTAAPLRDPERIRKLFTDRLTVLGDEADPGFGFDLIRLSALAVERLDPVQSGLSDGDPAREIAHLIDRLMARFGPDRVQRLVPQDTHIPELASLSLPANSMPKAAMAAQAFAQDSLIPVRPIRLFERPEPIEAIAQVPDGPPVRFTWRRVSHEVAQAEGPESIAIQWWRNDQGHPITRDYFRVENRQGARFWLYREGIYEDRDNPPNWFLHGIFA